MEACTWGLPRGKPTSAAGQCTVQSPHTATSRQSARQRISHDARCPSTISSAHTMLHKQSAHEALALGPAMRRLHAPASAPGRPPTLRRHLPMHAPGRVQAKQPRRVALAPAWPPTLRSLHVCTWAGSTYTNHNYAVVTDADRPPALCSLCPIACTWAGASPDAKPSRPAPAPARPPAARTPLPRAGPPRASPPSRPSARPPARAPGTPAHRNTVHASLLCAHANNTYDILYCSVLPAVL